MPAAINGEPLSPCQNVTHCKYGKSFWKCNAFHVFLWKIEYNMRIEIKFPDESKMETFMYLLMTIALLLLCMGMCCAGVGYLINLFI